MSWKVSMVAVGKGIVMQGQHAAVLAFELQFDLRPVLDRGNRLAAAPASRRVVEQRSAPGVHGLDMGLFAQLIFRQFPTSSRKRD